MRCLCVLMVLVASLLASGCTPAREVRYTLGDEELQPYAAMYQVDREEYCLTDIDPDSEVAIYGALRRDSGYDVGLSLRSEHTIRSVYFAWESGEYVWVRETETHYSGRTYTDFEGMEAPEMLCISYNARDFDRWGPMGLAIDYFGVEHQALQFSETCDNARAVLQEWEAERTASGDN